MPIIFKGQIKQTGRTSINPVVPIPPALVFQINNHHQLQMISYN